MTISRAFRAIHIGRTDKHFALDWVDDLSKLFRGEPILVIRPESSRLLLASSAQRAPKTDDCSLIVFAGAPDQAFLDRNSYFLHTAGTIHESQRRLPYQMFRDNERDNLCL